MSTGGDRFLNGLCSRCGKKREDGNDTIWCHSCTEKEKQSHTMELSDQK